METPKEILPLLGQLFGLREDATFRALLAPGTPAIPDEEPDEPNPRISATRTRSGAAVLWQMLNNPTANVDELRRRRAVVNWVRTRMRSDPKWRRAVEHQLSIVADAETAIAWLVEGKSDEEYQLFRRACFPDIPLIRNLNRAELPLTALLVYKIMLLPTLALVSPLIYVVMPFLIIRFKHGVHMPFQAYVSMVKEFANTRARSTTALSVALYAQNVVMAFCAARAVYSILELFAGKLGAADRVCRAAGEATSATEQSPNASAVWRFMHFDVKDLLPSLRRLAEVDAYMAIARIAPSSPKYSASRTRVELRSALALPRVAAVRNDIRVGGSGLKRGLFVTGPNAGGKSTYLRTALINVVLAQTVGAVMAKSAILTPFDRIISHMTSTDLIGKESLFQHEVRRTAETLRAVSQGGRSLVVIDELYGSTDPVEGASLARSYAEKLVTRHPNTCVIFSTHFRSIWSALVDTYEPVKLDVEFEPDTNAIRRPFKAKTGVSVQHIARELAAQGASGG